MTADMPNDETAQENKKVALQFVEKLFDNMEFGSLSFEVKKYRGLVGQVIVSGHRSTKYPNSATAIDELANRLELLAKNRFTGSISPAVIYEEGEITRIIFDEHHQIDLQKLTQKRKQK